MKVNKLSHILHHSIIHARRRLHVFIQQAADPASKITASQHHSTDHPRSDLI
jgi:hypothetical protein